MVKKMVSTHDGDAAKKLRFRSTFPGQTHFPELSHPLGFATIIALFAVAIAASVVVWWLKN